MKGRLIGLVLLLLISVVTSEAAVVIFQENFDGATPPGLPTGWAQVDVSGTAGEWATATATVHPSGQSPHSAPNLVYFKSWIVSSGNSTRLYYQNPISLSLPNVQAITLSLWMYHDAGFPSSQDRLQVQVSTDGTTWVDIGIPIMRYDGSTGWKKHEIDLSAYAGQNIYIGFLGISGYGNNIHIDDVSIKVFQGSEGVKLNESFEQWPPNGWNIVNNGGDCVWTSTANIDRDNYTGGTGYAAAADSDLCGWYTGHAMMNTSLITPMLDLSCPGNVSLEFKSDFYDLDNSDHGYVHISTDEGNSWIELLHYDRADYRTRTEIIDLTPYKNTDAQIKFTYIAPGWDWWWQLDDIKVLCWVCYPIPNGLISWWKAENNANDSLGANNGTLVNGATFAQGMVGQAFSFDGVDDYVSLPDSSNWDFGIGDFTIEGWINTSTPNATMRLISAGSQADGAYNLWAFGYGNNSVWGSGNRLNFAVYDADGYPYTDLNSNEITINANQWHHIAVVRSGTDLIFYFDGQQKGIASIGTLSLGGGSTGAIIGARYNTDSSYIIEFAKGLIDEVAIFNRALTAQEIAAIYNAGSAGKCLNTTLAITKQGVGMITSNPAGITCGADCTEVYTVGTTVTLTAQGIGSTFTGWGGDCSSCGSNLTCQVMMNGNKTCTATFEELPPPPSIRYLKVTKTGVGTGTVTSTPEGISCGADCSGNYEENTEVTLKVQLDEVSTFKGWGEDCASCGKNQECKVIMTKDKFCTAEFGKIACYFFSDVPCDHWAAEAIDAIYQRGITTGYPDGTFKPDELVTREQMAAFIVRALYGEEFEYPRIPIFSDVGVSDWSWKYIQKAKEIGVTKGCVQDDPGTIWENEAKYCPKDVVTREQMAAMLLRAMGVSAGSCSGGVFGDVNSLVTTEEFCGYIEELSRRGITKGCVQSPPMYCPKEGVTRAQMAVFLWRAFLGGR